MKKGLVMEGGAMRGLFTAGVTDVMMENGIEFDGAIGVSAGAAFGCNYKSKQIGRAFRYNRKYCRDKRYCSIRSLVFTGDMFGADFCYHKIPEELDVFDYEAFTNNPMPFYLVCTNVETGEPVYRKFTAFEDSFVEWCRASASLPMAARIVEIENMKLMDGGMADSIPIKFFESEGYLKNVVILTQPRGYVKEKNKLMPILRVAYKKYPGLLHALETRHEMYNATTEYIWQKEAKGELFVICPEKALPVGHTEHDPQVLDLVYDIGRKNMESRLDELKKYLSSDN